MALKYAKDQPAGFVNSIEKVVIVGASGGIGKHFAEELVKTGKHTVTALVRPDSTGTLPAGVKTTPVNYDDEESIISALKGQQFLIITLSVFAPPDLHSKIVQAAAKAGVPYVMPNSYGFDIMNVKLGEDSMYGGTALKHCTEIESTGVSSYIAMVCGFWYEWSLAIGPQWFGFDIKGRKVTFYDDGKTRINVSTWIQCGRAIAALLSLKELPEDENDKSPTVSQFKNKPYYISSFRVSQRDMLDELNSLIGTTDKDWEIDSEPSDERYKNGLAEMQKGERTGFAKAMYARVFYPNGDGDYESSRGLHNKLVGLQDDDIKAATKRAVDMVESGWKPFA